MWNCMLNQLQNWMQWGVIGNATEHAKTNVQDARQNAETIAQLDAKQIAYRLAQ